MRNPRKRFILLVSYQGMIKLGLTALLLGCAAVFVMYDFSSTRTWTDWSLPLTGKIIVVDAGHGGRDGGAVSKSGIVEKDITLAISFYLRDYLQQAGGLVLMTREEDKDLADPDTRGSRKRQDIVRRAALVRDRQADMLISVHSNAIPSSRWRGAQTFYAKQHADNELLAKLIQDEIRGNLANTDRLAKLMDRKIFLLEATRIPTALVEVGFLSNPEEAQLLADEAYQKKMASAIYRGILRYWSGEKLETP